MPLALLSLIVVLLLDVLSLQGSTQARVYVTNLSAASISVIDTATNKIVETISVPSGAHSLAITPDGRFLYITGFPSGDVSVLDTMTNKVIATVGVFAFSTSIAITPDGRFAYVPGIAFDKPDRGAIAVIDTQTRTVTAHIPLDQKNRPEDIAITPDGRFAYVTDGSESNTVSVIEAATRTVAATIPIWWARVLAVAPSGRFAYVTGYEEPVPPTALPSAPRVFIIDTGTNRVVGSIPINPYPRDMAITPDGRFAYVTNDVLIGKERVGGRTVSVIDTAANKVSTIVEVGPEPHGIAITPDGRFVYVAVASGDSGVEGSIAVIETATNRVTTKIAAHYNMMGIAMKPVKKPGE